MKLFAVFLLALASESYARSNADSSEEVSKEDSKEWKDQRRSSASSLLDASSYKHKVTQRIQNSNVLSDMHNIQEKLYKLADKKLEKCVTPARKALDRRCASRVTGQIMQLISAVEKSDGSASYPGDKRREKKSYFNI